ncbi:hypothetical protein [Aeromicrobium sp. Sec7.5]|uniref:hypothetical protein n=1 Tax=Aeromicrobium sp. Sec7.5 TaxID=3121276 RepID=UPI002FE49B92
MTLTAVAQQLAHSRDPERTAERHLPEGWRAIVTAVAGTGVVVAVTAAPVAAALSVRNEALSIPSILSGFVVALFLFVMMWACSDQSFALISRTVEFARMVQVLIFAAAAGVLGVAGPSFVFFGGGEVAWIVAGGGAVALAALLALSAMRGLPPILEVPTVPWRFATVVARTAWVWALTSVAVSTTSILWAADYQTVAGGAGVALIIAAVAYMDRLRASTNAAASEIRRSLTSLYLLADSASRSTSTSKHWDELRAGHFETLDVLANPPWRTLVSPSVRRADAVTTSMLRYMASKMYTLPRPVPSHRVDRYIEDLLGHRSRRELVSLLRDYVGDLHDQVGRSRRMSRRGSAVTGRPPVGWSEAPSRG